MARLLPSGNIERVAFDQVSRVHSSTLRKHFGGWGKALSAAGLADRFDGTSAKRCRAEILFELDRVARLVAPNMLTRELFEQHSVMGAGPVRREFGSWRGALAEVGLTQSKLGRRYSDEECYENLLKVWTHHGRPPTHDEMSYPPSTGGPKAYVRRWGGWLKALEAFVRSVETEPSEASEQAAPEGGVVVVRTPQGSRDVPLGLRYRVLKLGHFRCVTCGQSPATQLGVELHVDHIQPWSKGGATVLENLRVLCSACNLGKSDTVEDQPARSRAG